MRLALILTIFATTDNAWTFTPAPVCTLQHATDTATLTITNDPDRAQPYRLDITRDAPFAPAPVFALDFGGFAISTNRHALSPDARTLSVSDRGFGNVLSGLEAGTGAGARLGDMVEAFPTEEAAPAVRAFRDCPQSALS